MRPFKIIQGSSKNIKKFEEEISRAIEDGYEFSSDLISKTINKDPSPEIIFFQPMIIEEDLEFEEGLDYNYSEEDQND